MNYLDFVLATQTLTGEEAEGNRQRDMVCVIRLRCC
jgi:hypothetical protein